MKERGIDADRGREEGEGRKRRGEWGNTKSGMPLLESLVAHVNVDKFVSQILVALVHQTICHIHVQLLTVGVRETIQWISGSERDLMQL